MPSIREGENLLLQWIINPYIIYILHKAWEGHGRAVCLESARANFNGEWATSRIVALVEPVTITNNGRDRLVMMSTEEYRRLKRRDRRVMVLDDFTDADVAALEKVRAQAEAAAFNDEMTG